MKEQTATIRPVTGLAEAQWCARLMANSEPWLTLRRDYQAALSIVTDADIEKTLVVVGDKPAGFVLVVMNGAFSGYIKAIAVAPEFRNRGLGCQLLTYAEQRIFRERSNVFICVSSFNQDAKRLYERQGYDVIGLLPDYVVSGHSEYLMRKSIAPISEFRPQSANADGYQISDG